MDVYRCYIFILILKQAQSLTLEKIKFKSLQWNSIYEITISSKLKFYTNIFIKKSSVPL